MKLAFILFILVLFNKEASGSFLRAKNNRFTSSKYVCAAKFVDKTNLKIVKLRHSNEPLAHPPSNTDINMLCVNSATLAIQNVRYGLRDRVACPRPSALITFANAPYCKKIKKFFLNLKNKCKAPNQYIVDIFYNYGNITSNICAANQSVPLYLSSDFCSSEALTLNTTATQFNMSQTCVYEQFLKTFKFCQKQSASIPDPFTWIESTLSKVIGEDKCQGRKKCNINVIDDFPLHFPYDIYRNELLRIDYICKEFKTTFHPERYKQFKMQRQVLFNRKNQPNLINVRLTSFI